MSGFVQRCSIGGKGLTVAVKDTIDVAALPTMAGSRALEEATPATTHAAVVKAVLDRGAEIIGKTVCHEFAYGMTGVNAWAGTPLNPLFPALVPGGSSSGSATVVAAGLADVALGTDTGGSIRLPAACCGIYGLKPTFGRVSRDGVLPALSSLDCVGPMAATIGLLIEGMALIDPTFAEAEAVEAPVLGVPTVLADPAITAAVAGALARSGVQTRPVALAGMGDAFDAGMVIINAETWAACGGYLDTGKVGDDVAARLRKAANTTSEDVARAETIRARFTADVDAALDGVDALVLPTLPSFPMTLEDAQAGKVDLTASSLVRPFNLSGHPALSIPLPAVEGRPVGVQLVGRKGQDAALCAIARRLVVLLSGFDQ